MPEHIFLDPQGKIKNPDEYDSFSLRPDVLIQETYNITLKKPVGKYTFVVMYKKNDEWRDDPSWPYLDSLIIMTGGGGVIELSVSRMKNGDITIEGSSPPNRITREDLKSIKPNIMGEILRQLSVDARSLLEKLLE